MSNQPSKKKSPATLKPIYRALERSYGRLRPLRTEPPLNSLVRTILSQNTSDVNSDRAYRSLRQYFPRWEQVAEAPVSDIAKAIHSGGLARIKAARIRQVLRLIRSSQGRLSLARIKLLSQADALKWLTDLPGVGVKTANCVMLFGFGHPVMPVDTHVYRLTQRLGWITPSIPIDLASAHLQRRIPARWIYPLHLYLIAHGRSVCHARRPACMRCILMGHCPYGRRATARPRFPKS